MLQNIHISNELRDTMNASAERNLCTNQCKMKCKGRSRFTEIVNRIEPGLGPKTCVVSYGKRYTLLEEV